LLSRNVRIMEAVPNREASEMDAACVQREELIKNGFNGFLPGKAS